MPRFFKNKDLLLTGLASLVPAVCQLFFMRYVSYNIPLDLYGKYVLLLIFVSGCNLIGMTLVQSSAVRFYHEAQDKSQFIGEQVALVILFSCLFLPLFILYFVMNDDYSFLIGAMLFCYFLFYNVLLLAKSMVLQALKRGVYLLFIIAETFSNLILPILIFQIWPTIEGLVFAISAGVSSSSVLIFLFSKKINFSLLKIKYSNLNKYFIYSYPFVLSSMGSWTISFSDRYFIDWLISPSAVGVYSLLSQFGGAMFIIGGFISLYINPILLSEFTVNKNKTIQKYKQYSFIILILLIITSFLAVNLPDFMYTLLLSENVIFKDGNFAVMSTILLAITILIFANYISNYFILLKKTKALVPIWFFAAILNIAGNFFLIPIYGLYGAALSTLIAYTTVFLLFLGYVLITERNTKAENVHV